jgi:hypothetical protein
MKFKITRVWYVEADNADDAVRKTKNWKHDDLIVEQSQIGRCNGCP